MSFELSPDPNADPAPVETSTLLIYLRGGQTIRHEVTAWDVKKDSDGYITHFTWADRWPGQGMPYLRLSAINAVVVMSTAAPK
jgi:hypothetical protein